MISSLLHNLSKVLLRISQQSLIIMSKIKCYSIYVTSFRMPWFFLWTAAKAAHAVLLCEMERVRVTWADPERIDRVCCAHA